MIREQSGSRRHQHLTEGRAGGWGACLCGQRGQSVSLWSSTQASRPFLGKFSPDTQPESPMGRGHVPHPHGQSVTRPVVWGLAVTEAPPTAGAAASEPRRVRLPG